VIKGTVIEKLLRDHDVIKEGMLVSLFDALRVVYILQSCPMDDAVRLLSPILSAETWVRLKKYAWISKVSPRG